VIHRDIKPGNIMLNPRGEVKVTDFGIARVTTTADTVAQTAAILGTASYLSPEQAQGQPVDARSDLYSLGCVVYEMVTGRPPFLGDSPVAVASKQVLEQPVPPSKLNSDVTPDLDAVILRALAKNPANRYQSAEEMRADLERAKRGLPVDATPLLAAGATQVLDRPPAQATQVLPPSEPERRNNWVPIAVTLVLIALLGALLWFLASTLLDDDPQAPVSVEVPNVVGDKRAQAISEIEEAGLEVGTITPVAAAGETQEPGTVVEQDPAAGDEVERGTAVDLTIVESPALVAIPNLEGSSVEEAEAALLELGLEPTGPVDEPSETVDEGSVTRTDPGSGEEVDPGSTVTIFVSTGPDQVSVPLVTCLSFGSAQNKIEQAGLIPVDSPDTVALNSQCPLGNKVAAQDPPSGTLVQPGSTVTLFQGEEGTTGPTGPTGETGE
jgi:serine/threonine-protein kinase